MHSLLHGLLVVSEISFDVSISLNILEIFLWDLVGQVGLFLVNVGAKVQLCPCIS